MFQGLSSIKTQSSKVFHIMGERYALTSNLYIIFDDTPGFITHDISAQTGLNFNRITSTPPLESVISENHYLFPKFTNNEPFSTLASITQFSGAITFWALISNVGANTQF